MMAFDQCVALAMCYHPFAVGRTVKMHPEKPYALSSCAVHFANINIGPRLEAYITSLLYLHWQAGIDVAAGTATGTGPFFPSLFSHIRNIYT
jgi:hypothetical protein